MYCSGTRVEQEGEGVMQRALRLAVMVGAAFAALGFTGNALAAYTPKLTISHSNARVQGGGSTTIAYEQSRDDQATAKVTFYVPQGYSGVLNQPAGTQIGTVSAQVQLNAISPDTIPTITGTIKTDNPASYTSNPATVACVGPAGGFSAVWLLELTASGQTLRVPAYIYVLTAAPEVTFAQYKIVACLPPPAIATFGAKVLKATLNLQNVFTLPSAAGEYTWRLVATPYATNAGPTDAPNTVEAQAFVRLSAQLTANLKIVNRKKKVIRIAGALSEFRSQIGGIAIRLLIGTKVCTKCGAARTTAGGKYSFRLQTRSKRVTTTTFRARAVVPARVGTCGTAIPGIPRGCVNATIAGFTVLSRAVRVRI
jgi:hypothetical protein